MALATCRPGWASGLRECGYRYIDDHGVVADGRTGEENGFIGLCFQHSLAVQIMPPSFSLFVPLVGKVTGRGGSFRS